MADPVGYVFGYGTLAAADDEHVAQVLGGRSSVEGAVAGFRRRYCVGMENRAPLNDGAYYVDAATGERPDIVAVALGLEPGDTTVNGVAIPVGADALPGLDRRELHYDRIDVGDRFTPALDLPVWTYVPNALGREDFERGRAEGRAFIRRTYVERVEQAFRARGDDAWRAFVASTDPPEVPLRDLVHVKLG